MKNPFNVLTFSKVFLLCSAVILIFSVQVSRAREIAGVTVPETDTMESTLLVLNGAGIRKKFFVKIYVGALYLTRKQATAAQILSDPGAKRIVMSFLYKEVSAEKLVDGWNEGFESNNSAEELRVLRESINRFNSFFTTVRKGDVIRLDYTPEQGSRIWLNDMLKGSVAGEDFYRALLKIWLGSKPADAGLKDAMLGNAY